MLNKIFLTLCFFVIVLETSCSNGSKVPKKENKKKSKEQSIDSPPSDPIKNLNPNDKKITFHNTKPKTGETVVNIYDRIKDNPFFLDPGKFDLDHEKAMEFIGIVLNGSQTLGKDGGFYKSTAKAQSESETGPKGSYTLYEETNNNEKTTYCTTSFSSYARTIGCQDKNVYNYDYNEYKAHTDSEVSVHGSLTGVKDYPNQNQITIGGSLQIYLLDRNNSDPHASGRTIYVYFGDYDGTSRDSDGNLDAAAKAVVFDENNIAQKGRIEISHTKNGEVNSKEKTYNLAQLSEIERNELEALGLFRTKAYEQNAVK